MPVYNLNDISLVDEPTPALLLIFHLIFFLLCFWCLHKTAELLCDPVTPNCMEKLLIKRLVQGEIHYLSTDVCSSPLCTAPRVGFHVCSYGNRNIGMGANAFLRGDLVTTSET